jgi:hypothetical protein
VDQFLERLQSLPSVQLAQAEANPEALPLLCCDAVPNAQKVFGDHGNRAWRLFRGVNFADHPEDLERVAQAVDRYGELILQINEDFGLAYALLMIPPDTRKGSRHLPEVVKHALRTLEDYSTALALILTNHRDLTELLDSGKSVQDLNEAIDLFRSLSPVVRNLASDHSHTLRLLTETWKGQKLGAEVLRRCGPSAADLVYTHYASKEALKSPALVALAKLGETGRGVFQRFSSYHKFHALLQRADPADLMNPRENPPAIVLAINSIARNGQEQVDIYADVRDLKGQVLADVRGALPEEAYFEWVPGYVAIRGAADALKGRHVTGGDMFWATIDGVSTATLVYGPVVNGLKKAGGKFGEEAVAAATRQGLSQAERAAAQTSAHAAEREVGQALEKLALRTLHREEKELVRFGDKAGEKAIRRLEARTGGLKLDVADRHEKFLQLTQAKDINGKARLIEEVGEEGAKKYALHIGYEPIFQGKPGKGMGFDQVYRDGNRIKVIEAKGGRSSTQSFRGGHQGTIEYSKDVAERTLKSPATSAEEKKAATEVLKAARESRLDVEVVRTEHVQGRPTITRVEKVVGPEGPVRLSVDEARSALLRTPGMANAWVREVGGASSDLNLRELLRQARPVARSANLALWVDGSGPLAPRDVVRMGISSTLPVQELPNEDEAGQVGEFAVALMESEMIGAADNMRSEQGISAIPATGRESIKEVQTNSPRNPTRTVIVLALMMAMILLAIPFVRRTLWNKVLLPKWVRTRLASTAASRHFHLPLRE